MIGPNRPADLPAVAAGTVRTLASTPGPSLVTVTDVGTSRVKRSMAEMLKGGVIMDVGTAERAKISENAGAVAVMALERVPVDIGVELAETIVRTTTFFGDPDMVVKVPRGLGEARVGINVDEKPQPHPLSERGW